MLCLIKFADEVPYMIKSVNNSTLLIRFFDRAPFFDKVM